MNVANSRGATLCAGVLTFLTLLFAASAHAGPRDGWWWNAAESGRGFFLERQGTRMFMSGYFYAADGRATWLVSNDEMPNPNAYDARLLAFSNGQTLAGTYRPPGPPADAGPVSLRFIDDRNATLTWAGGTVPLVRYQFQRGPNAAMQPRTGWWWNPAESGRGFSVELQGDHMFIAAYMYDTAGNPVWYVADAFMQSPKQFQGPLLQFAGGQTLTGPYRAPAAPVVAGTLTIDFASSDAATVTLSDEPWLGPKTVTSFPIQPQYTIPLPVQPPFVAAAKRWTGEWLYKQTVTSPSVVFTLTVESLVTNWLRRDDLSLGQYPAFYTIESGFAVFDMVQTGPEDCTFSGAASGDLTQGELTVNADLTYFGKISKEVQMPVKGTCDGESNTSNIPTPVDFHFYGTVAPAEDQRMLGVVAPSGSANLKLDGYWDFSPRF